MPDMVHVPVPVDGLQEVYEVLARRPAAPSAVHVTDDGYPYGWSRELFDRMFVESSSAMRRVHHGRGFHVLRWVNTVEIADASGLTARQMVARSGRSRGVATVLRDERATIAQGSSSTKAREVRHVAGSGELHPELAVQVETDEKVNAE